MVTLSHLNKSNAAKLKSLNDNSPFQFLPGYTDFFKTFYGDDLEIFYSASLDAFIPIRFFQSRVFRSGQILHAPISNNVVLDIQTQHLFFAELLHYFKQDKICDRLIQPNPFGILNTVPSGATYCRFGTYVNDLENNSEEELFNRFQSKYQKAIQHSKKLNARIEYGHQILQDFYSCYKATMDRSGMKAEPIDYFESLIKYLGETHATPGVVYDNENPCAIGCVFILHSNYSAFCTHAGSQGASKLYGAMKLLHWETMIRFKKMGVRKYDLVGVRLENTNSSLEGIFKFKKGFGGELIEGYLWKINIRTMRTKLYDLLIKVRNANKAEMKDIIDQVNYKQ